MLALYFKDVFDYRLIYFKDVYEYRVVYFTDAYEYYIAFTERAFKYRAIYFKTTDLLYVTSIGYILERSNILYRCSF